MNPIYLIIFFILGLFMGSFYTVVGLRLPKHESFIKGRSHCDSCNHELSFIDMIPIISYLFLKGKCRYCKKEISNLSTYMELFTAILFTLSYYVFGFSYELFIALGIVTMLIIISVSDLSYFVIPDEILIFFTGYFLIIFALQKGVILTSLNIFSGLVLFCIMYTIMLIGNFLFKKETLGGGDIKMMFVFGIILHPLLGLISIFIGSVLALPVSLFLLYKKNERLIPFGPFLLISFTFIYFTGLSVPTIIEFIKLL
jgi:leader peptidase (prepilin peptidase)/N-methyltransferase